ncbi:DUF192 domain-containing protein [Halapricum hydrolyticum]|uniref:DUF192 domain-containing protein n=1 Tax=Halapricum hydrolyticum TaxID=2979991 RepID=A0AAE3LF74_9EURY|nr:DUF192 domain-containing protein [Halapricum hydrolyticum]MCU4719131.1 DUF192 domain-containing protein [Halapricum hydrolyticum]MCU4727321.1 DUF192 domain-containing protein [Halapricum hydrolyticum]
MDWPDRDRLVTFVIVGLVVLAVGVWALHPTGPLGGLLHPLDYEETTIALTDENGTELATVDVRVADSEREHYVGLSETDSLADGEGMLFVFSESQHREFVMRGMDFPLDIVFAAPDGTITTIHHAPVPEQTPGDDLRRYSGTGKYVLEVPRGFTNATGVEVGDCLVVPDGSEGTSCPE